jgi:hypothetical protein
MSMQRINVGIESFLSSWVLLHSNRMHNNRIKNWFFSKSGAWKIALFSPAGS